MPRHAVVSQPLIGCRLDFNFVWVEIHIVLLMQLWGHLSQVNLQIETGFLRNGLPSMNWSISRSNTKKWMPWMGTGRSESCNMIVTDRFTLWEAAKWIECVAVLLIAVDNFQGVLRE